MPKAATRPRRGQGSLSPQEGVAAMSVSGIDVSDYQNPIDWSAVAGVDLDMRTEGLLISSPTDLTLAAWPRDAN